MKNVVKAASLGALLAGSLVVAPAATAVAASAEPAGHPASGGTVQPAYSCTIDSYGEVLADWLRVHTQASVTSSVVGQVPYGSRFHYCSSSGHWNGGYYWVYGYGYNGSTKLTGWVDYEYLAHP